MKFFIFLFVVLLCQHSVICGGKKYKNKYSAEANNDGYSNEIKQKNNENPPHSSDEKNARKAEAKQMLKSNDLPTEKYDPDFRTLQKPFRMAKLNLVWVKAQQVSFFAHDIEQ